MLRTGKMLVTIASGGVLAALALVAPASAATAKATPEACGTGYSRLYLQDPDGDDLGLTAEGAGNGVEVQNGTGDCWQFPAGGTTGEIYDGSNCVEFSESAGDITVMATCKGNPAEEWESYDYGSYTFESQWALNNGYAGPWLTAEMPYAGSYVYLDGLDGDLSDWNA